MTTPDISVVMAVYNGAPYLRETIESVLSQESVSFELVIVNDGSTDGTQKLLDNVADSEQRVRVIHQANQGLTRALITGCGAATGKYIARQDVGDVSCANRLALQRAAFNINPDIAFVSCWTTYAGPDWEPLFTLTSSRSNTEDAIDIRPAGLDDHFVDGPTHHGSVMFRTDSYRRVGGYRPEFYFAQDFDLWLRLSERGLFRMVNSALYQARITPESISSSNKRNQEALARLAWSAFRARERGDSDTEILNRARTITPQRGKSDSRYTRSKGNYFIGETLRRNRDERAFAYLSKAAKEFPLNVRPWLRLAQCRLSR